MNAEPTRKLPHRRSPTLLIKDLGGLGLYFPGQALMARTPRSWLHPLSRLGGGLVRRMASDGAEMRDELQRLFGDRPLPRKADAIVAATRAIARLARRGEFDRPRRFGRGELVGRGDLTRFSRPDERGGVPTPQPVDAVDVVERRGDAAASRAMCRRGGWRGE